MAASTNPTSNVRSPTEPTFLGTRPRYSVWLEKSQIEMPDRHRHRARPVSVLPVEEEALDFVGILAAAEELVAEHDRKPGSDPVGDDQQEVLVLGSRVAQPGPGEHHLRHAVLRAFRGKDALADAAERAAESTGFRVA